MIEKSGLMEKKMGLVEILYRNNEPITSKSLAQQLMVSDRTVRNYVRELNQLLNKVIITSGKNGYILEKKYYEELVDYFADNIKQSAAYRRQQLLQHCLMYNKEVAIEELLDCFNISENTLHADLLLLSKTYESFSLAFKKNSDHLVIDCSEIERRNLMLEVFREENGDLFLLFYLNQNYMVDQDIMFIYRLVRKELAGYEIEINEFSLNRLVVYLVVTVFRLKEGFYIEKNKSSKNLGKKMLGASGIFGELAFKFNVEIVDTEVNYLSELLNVIFLKKNLTFYSVQNLTT